MPSDRPWSDADRELVWAVLNEIDCHDDGAAEAVLDALTAAGKLRNGCPCSTGCDETDPEHVAYWQGYWDREREQIAAGWRREADVRAEVSQELAGAVRPQLTGEEPTDA